MTITATAPRAAAYRGRLRWWTELPLIAVIYALYSGARLLVRGDVNDAVEHGADILHFEQLTHLDPERWFNQLFTHHAFLGVPADFAYASLHYVVTPSVLVWLWLRRPTHYRNARTWLMVSTLIGLVGFTVVPTAPPRLLPGAHGFMDTMAQYGSYGWWGTDASAPRGMGHLTNEYAAMPSLHVGWSLWCGIMLFRYGRNWFVRALGVIYPLMTAFVVMGTANHYLMDAAAGVATMGVGFLLAKPALRVVDGLQARVRRRLGTEPVHEAVVAVSVAPGAPADKQQAAAPGGAKVPAPRTVSVPPGDPGDPGRDPGAAGGSGAGRGERSRMS
ncbi:phosphatase PAP2 family protein [Streptomyces sp. IBSBF 2435]|uniref:phosphatase PAP2 family protein n=1 Tax=Streptomyces sp. IBSBF 2435 TaxID=2903531 RepID=UPI002FDC1D9F